MGIEPTTTTLATWCSTTELHPLGHEIHKLSGVRHKLLTTESIAQLVKVQASCGDADQFRPVRPTNLSRRTYCRTPNPDFNPFVSEPAIRSACAVIYYGELQAVVIVLA
jgi:hypothetical protein